MGLLLKGGAKRGGGEWKGREKEVEGRGRGG